MVQDIDRAAFPAGMRPAEYARLKELLAASKPTQTLEIGMANGGSSQVICEHLHTHGGAKHTTIDPFQNAASGYAGAGVERVRAAGYAHMLDLIEDYDYLALPRLVAENRLFDFVLIDGWHSFDYTLLDIFYADLLLRDGGVLAIHDTGWPSVFRACRFLETHKPYDLLSPPPQIWRPSLLSRIWNRVRLFFAGPAAMRAAHTRRTEWHSLAAYRKRSSSQVANDGYVDF